MHSDHDLGDDGPQELLALTPGRGRRVEHRPDICTGLLQPHHLFLRQRGGLAEALSREAGLGLALGHEGLFQGALQRPGDEAVLGFHGVELTTGPFCLEAGAFHRQLERPDVSAVVGVRLLERLRRRRQAGRLEHREDLVEHAVLKTAASHVLASTLTPIERLVAATDVARGVAAGARIADLHHPPALPAADPALEEGRPFANRTTPVTPGRPPVGTKPVLDRYIP